MSGRNIGSLNILTKEGAAAAVSQQQYNDQQSSSWISFSKELSLTSSTKIIIEAVIGGSNSKQDKGDIAVDNIKLTAQSCTPASGSGGSGQSSKGNGKNRRR